jgi:hypothetical protein
VAVAAHYANNRCREVVGLTPVTSRDGIVKSGTALTFYKIHISSDFVTVIGRANYATVVSKGVPSVLNLHWYLDEGMVPLENRRLSSSAWRRSNRSVGGERSVIYLRVVRGLISGLEISHWPILSSSGVLARVTELAYISSATLFSVPA